MPNEGRDAEAARLRSLLSTASFALHSTALSPGEIDAGHFVQPAGTGRARRCSQRGSTCAVPIDVPEIDAV